MGKVRKKKALKSESISSNGMHLKRATRSSRGGHAGVWDGGAEEDNGRGHQGASLLAVLERAEEARARGRSAKQRHLQAQLVQLSVELLE